MGNIAYITKARVVLLRDLGPALSPFQLVFVSAGPRDPAFENGAPCRNALAVAEYLEKHPKVALGQLSGADFQLRKKPGRTNIWPKVREPLSGSALKGGIEAGKKFIEFA